MKRIALFTLSFLLFTINSVPSLAASYEDYKIDNVAFSSDFTEVTVNLDFQPIENVSLQYEIWQNNVIKRDGGTISDAKTHFLNIQSQLEAEGYGLYEFKFALCDVDKHFTKTGITGRNDCGEIYETSLDYKESTSLPNLVLDAPNSITAKKDTPIDLTVYVTNNGNVDAIGRDEDNNQVYVSFNVLDSSGNSVVSSIVAGSTGGGYYVGPLSPNESANVTIETTEEMNSQFVRFLETGSFKIDFYADRPWGSFTNGTIEESNENDNNKTITVTVLEEGDNSTGSSSETKSDLPPAGYEDEVITNFTNYNNPFPDTNIGTIEGYAAAELYRRAIIGGYPDGEFKGYREVNRAEAAKFLLLARYVEVDNIDNNEKFPDVKEGEWYVKFVITCANLGIINGYPDGLFKPANTVNTAEFLKMLSLTFDLELNMSHNYTDVSPSDWFAPYAGIVKKYELFPNRSTQLKPAALLTRNEVAVAIYQYLKNRE